MLTDDEQFENNLMPKLKAAYDYAIEYGRTDYEFDLGKVREFLKEGDGLGVRAWEDQELKDRLTYLVKKGLIKEVSNGWYRLTESGRSWEKARS